MIKHFINASKILESQNKQNEPNLHFTLRQKFNFEESYIKIQLFVFMQTWLNCVQSEECSLRMVHISNDDSH